MNVLFIIKTYANSIKPLLLFVSTL